MKLLLLVALLGLVSAQDPVATTPPPSPWAACDVLLPNFNFQDSRVTVMVTDGMDQPVTEIRNNMVLKVIIMVPQTNVHIRALLGIGHAAKWRPLMPSACHHIDGTVTNTVVFTFNIAQVNATEDESLVDLRVAVISGDELIRTIYKTMSYKYTGQESEPRSTTMKPSTSSTASTLKARATTPKAVVEDPHDSRLEANLAAKWAELQAKMAEDEDRNSEGDWQKLEEEEKRKHDEEIQKEEREFEERNAEERRQRDEMIRREMMDKEENERIEKEEEEAARRRAASSTPAPSMVEDVVEPQENGVVDLDNNGIVVKAGAPSHTGLVPLLVLVASMIAAILM